MATTFDTHINPNYNEYFNKMVRLPDTDTWITQRYTDFGIHGCVKNFLVNENDILVASFPKSGTTLLQEIVYLIATDCDVENSKDKVLEERFPFIEFQGYLYGKDAIKKIANIQSPRYIKTHLQFEAIPNAIQNGSGKIIYIARNPKDVLCSFYPFSLNTMNYVGTFDEFYEDFMNGKIAWGSWCSNVLSYWKRRDNGNVLFLTYEELQKDKEGVLDKIASFLGKNLTPQNRDSILHHTSFHVMKDNPATNHEWLKDMGIMKKDADVPFMRKGKVGSWKENLSEEQQGRIDRMCKEQLEPEGLSFMDVLH